MEPHTMKVKSPTEKTEISEIKNPTDIRVLGILSKEGPLTRTQLVTKTNIARSTLFDSLLRLILKGLVTKFSERPQERGRPKVYFQTV